MTEEEVFKAVGEEGLTRLVAAFYRQVKTDDILRPMYPEHDLEGAERRLRDFLIFRFGGPQRYIEERGHPRLRMRHAPFLIDRAARDRWVELMDRALVEAEFAEEPAAVARAFFHHIATFLINKLADR